MQTTYGQESDTPRLNVDLTECIEITSDEERFACFQQRADQAVSERPSTTGEAPAEMPRSARQQAPTQPAQPATERAAARPESNSEAPDSRRTQRSERKRERRRRDEISATITELRETIPNQWVISLDNGQIWQMISPAKYPMRVGQAATLRSTRWGPAYRLTVSELGGQVSVRKVR